jgi:hypothetical protein
MDDREPTPEEMAALKRRIAASPISGLIQNFQGSPFAGAPERKLELDRMVQQLGTRIQLSWPGTAFLFGVTECHGIRVGLCALERLWAYSYGYYQSYLMATSHPPATLVSRDPAVAKLLGWSHTEAKTPIESPWPAGTARPDRPMSGSEIPIVNEIFLMMSAWILLHEFGHIIRDDKYDESPEGQIHNHTIEFAADAWAFRFLLDRWTSYSTNPDVLLKRGIGIGLAIFIISADRFFKKPTSGHTHPHPIDRLLRFFDYLEMAHQTHAKEVTQVEYAACICLFGTMAPHIQAESLATRFATPRECIEYLRPIFKPVAI